MNRFASVQTGTWLLNADSIDKTDRAFFLLLEHEGTKFVKECRLLMDAYDHFYSYHGEFDMGARLMDLTCAVNRFVHLYEKELPKFSYRLKQNYHFMDTKSIKLLIAENETEVRGVLKREEKERKKTEIKSASQNFEV